MLTLLKLLYACIAITMIVVTVDTSLQSNLIEAFPRLAQEPWMTATLKDFYFNILIIYSWVFYKERRWSRRIIWLTAFVLLGSIATAFYVLVQLLKLKPGEGVEQILTKRV